MGNKFVVEIESKENLPARAIGCRMVVWQGATWTRRTDVQGNILVGSEAGQIEPYSLCGQPWYIANEEQTALLGLQAAK